MFKNPQLLQTHYSYRVMDPIRFRAGDIVEAQVTFCAVPIKGERYRMLVTLRSIMLLDSEPLRVRWHLHLKM